MVGFRNVGYLLGVLLLRESYYLGIYIGVPYSRKTSKSWGNPERVSDKQPGARNRRGSLKITQRAEDASNIDLPKAATRGLLKLGFRV